MAFRVFKRHKQTAFGDIIHKRGSIGTNLLITPNGKKLGLKYGSKLGRLLRSVRVDKHDNVSFSDRVHPLEIGHGVHAKVFRVFPKEQAQFFETGQKHSTMPSVVLKIYRESVSKKQKPDGFTQFFANTTIFNYLKNIPAKGYVIRPLQTYFVSEKLLARKFINRLTLGEAYRAFKGIKLIESETISNAFTDQQVFHLLGQYKTSLKEIEFLDSRVKRDIEQGAKTGFNTNHRIEPDLAHMENVFFLGHAKKGEPEISVIDQGKKTIKGLGNQIRKGTVFLSQ